MLSFYDRAHEEQSDNEEEYEEDVPQPAQPEALVVDTIDVWHLDAAAPKVPGFIEESLNFWATLGSFIPVSPLKSPLFLYDNDSL